QLHRHYPRPGYRNRKQGAVWRGMQIQRPWRLACGTIAMVLGVIARSRCRGFRDVSRRSRMPRFLYPSHAPLDPALVLFAQLSLADLEDLARPNPEFANLLCHHRRHVHDPIAFEGVHDLFAIASFDAFAIVPAQGYFDWGVGVESQNSIRHCCSPCSCCSGGSNPSSGGSGKSSGGSSSSSCSSSGSSPLNPDWPYEARSEGAFQSGRLVFFLSRDLKPGRLRSTACHTDRAPYVSMLYRAAGYVN